uniref:Peptidase M60 domain-containing protein n=1 Tax=Sinocyclocheilus grahami TaxID=75366 RepID=A0A672MIQ2_SINGR
MKITADLAARPGKFPRKKHFYFADVQISHGFMHAGYPIMMHSNSAPALVNVQEAYKSGIWGAIHELGHNQQLGVWEFPPHTTECTCNLWSVYAHEEVLGLNRSNAHPAMTLENTFSKVVNLNLCPFFKAWGWPIHLPEWSDHPMYKILYMLMSFEIIIVPHFA